MSDITHGQLRGYQDNWFDIEYERRLVSVVIPTFNRAHVILETLDSVWSQTYRPIEMIVVDDGSSDDTADIVREWMGKHSDDPGFSTRFTRQENSGAPTARNRGFRVSKGKYIQFLDSDDVLSERKIEHQVNTLVSSGEVEGRVVAFCESVFFDDGSDPRDGKLQRGRRMSSSDDAVGWLTDILGWDGRGGMVAPHAWLVTRDIAKTVGPWREGLTTDQDGEYFSRVVLASARIVKTKGKAYYRVNREHASQSSRETASDYRSLLTAIRLKEERLLERARPEQLNRVRTAAARHFIRVAYEAYPAHPSISSIAEKWARERTDRIEIPRPSSFRRKLLHRIVGWKGARIASYLYHG